METPIKKMGSGVGVMILKDGKILLGQRHSDPTKAASDMQGQGAWTMPGGKLEFGESFEECGRREVLEETGIAVDAKDLELISLTNDFVPTAHYVTIGLLCTKFSGDAKVMEPDTITKWDWFDIDNLPTPLFNLSQRVIDNYKSGKIYNN